MTAIALKRDELLTADNLLLLTLGGVALLFGYLSFSPPSLSVRAAGGEKVATISDVDQTVKRKPAGALAWDEAEAPDELHTGDQIFTDKASQAKVRFDDGSEIALAENSLVKIEKQGGKTTLDMSKGFVSGKFGGSGKGEFTIKMGGTQVKLAQGAELQAKVDPNDKNATRVALVSGDGAVQAAGGKTLALAKNQVLSVDTKTGAATVQEVTVSLLLPKVGEQLDAGDNPTLFFKWDAKNPSLVYTVVVARDSRFQDVVTRRETSNKALTIPTLPSGTYYWKVQSEDRASGKRDESIQASFTLVRLDPPELLAPVPGKIFQMEGAARAVIVSFLWRAGGPARAFELEVACDRAFTQPVLKRQLADSAFDAKDLAEGAYFWRVRSRGESAAKVSPYSSAQEFKIERAQLPSAPRLAEPKAGGRFAPSEAVTFRWDAVQGASSYQFELSRTKAFAAGDVTSTKNVDGTVLTMAPDVPGSYFWRVKAVDPFGREAPYSEARALTLDATAPQLIAPDDGARITLAQKSLKIDFTWLKSPGAKSYQLEVARDENFKDLVLQKKLQDPGFEWNKLSPGEFYWRVRAEMPGVKDGVASPARRFNVKGLELLAPPVLKDRYYFRLPPPPAGSPGTAMLRTLYRVFMAGGTAFAQDATSEVDAADSDKVNVHWKAIAGADSYLVEVAADQDFAKVLLRHKTKAPTFVWPEAPPGRYFLRAAAVDAYEQTGKYSRIAELIVNYRAPKLYEPQDQAKYKLGDETLAIDFTWQSVGGDPLLWLEIAKDKDFVKPLVSKAVKGGSARIPTLPEGEYFWRIRAKYRAGLPVEAARPFRFQIASAKLKAPVALAPTLTDGHLKLAWDDVKNAERYEVTIARDLGFTDLSSSQTVDGREAEADLTPGTYYAKVRALGAAKAHGPDSEIKKLTVESALAAPDWQSPTPDQEFVSTGKNPPAVDFAFSAVAGAAGYTLELAATEQFKKILKRVTLKEPKTSLPLGKGHYFARVKAFGPKGEHGKSSELRGFSVVRHDVVAPDLLYPEDGDQLSRSGKVRLNWTKENAFTGYRVVLSRDPKFKDVVYDKTVDKDAQAVAVPKTGKYYWYVEGKDAGKKYAMRSDVQTFSVSDYAPAGGDRIRIMAAYAPSVISNTMVGDTVSNSLSVAAFNSFMVNGQYWFSRPLGLEAAYQRKSAELYSEDKLEGSPDQKPLAFIPQNFDLRAKFRFMLGGNALSPELHARGGYMYKTFYTYFPTSRTALDLAETRTHSLSLGVGAKFPLALDQYLEGAVDLAKPLASSPSKVTGGQYLMVDSGYYLLFPSRLTAGLGYRFASATYSFVDDSHDVSGILQEKSYTVLGSIGYGF